MKIDVNGGYNIYRKNLGGESSESAQVKSASAGASEKTDVASFSHGSTAIADKGLLSLKSNLQRDISYPASSERITQLRQDVKNGAYRVPTEALIDSILGD